MAVSRASIWCTMAGLFSAATASMCAAPAPPIATFSPDGSCALVTWRTARTDTPGAALVDVASGGVHLVEERAPVSGAALSPDGRYVAYATTGVQGTVTRLLDRRTGRTRNVPLPMEPPYCWREDGARLAGVQRDDSGVLSVVVFNIREFGLSYRAAVELDRVAPDSMLWLEHTDDVAFLGIRGDQTDVCSVESGEFRRLSTTGDVVALAHGKTPARLLWARRSKNTRYILLSLYEYDTDQRTVRRLAFPDRVPEINPAPARSPIRVRAVALEPRLNRLAVVAEYAGTTQTQTVIRLFTSTLDGTGVRLVRSAIRNGTDPYPALTPFFCVASASLGVLHEEAAAQALLLFNADGTGGRVIARCAVRP